MSEKGMLERLASLFTACGPLASGVSDDDDAAAAVPVVTNLADVPEAEMAVPYTPGQEAAPMLPSAAAPAVEVLEDPPAAAAATEEPPAAEPEPPLLSDALIDEIKAELFADDVDVPPAAKKWTEAQLREVPRLA